jgi:hemolysin activation/secretion protein
MALRDHLKVGATGIYTDRHIEALSASFSGDFRDALTSDDITFWSVDPTIGKLAFDDKSAQSFDDISAHTQGNFSKLTSSLLHVKNLDAHRQLFIGFKGQWASTNLDSSQKMAAGGPYSVRAYAAAALAGDQGYLLNAELKQHLGSALNGQWTATAFFDTTAITVNKKPWVASENNATLSGVGLGLIWTGPSQTTGTAYIAKPTGPRSSLVGSVSSVQFSLELQKRF